MMIHEAAAQIKAGKLTPVELLEQCLQRVDQYEEKVRAWVFVDREFARSDAERLTQELKKGQNRGPLHGIPIGVKDIFDVADWPTAAGSKRWANAIAREDCPVVAKLRQAGAVLMGKTVTTAFASFDPPITRNPWNVARTPGGSSSGSAAAVACGMCLGALASQTGGSITRPAAYCGVCGIKPTYGRVDLAGVVPLAHSMDHAGAIAGCVEDLALILQVLADANGRVIDGSPVPDADDYVCRLHEKGEALEAGRFRGLFEEKMEPAMRSVYDEALRRLQAKGLTIWEFPLPPAFSEVTARHQMVMAVEAAQFHEPRFRRRRDDYPARISALIEEGLSVSAAEFARTKEHQLRLKIGILESFLDGRSIAITPATSGAAPDASSTGLPTMNSPWSYVGLPTVSFPIGWSADGLPLSMQLVGLPWDEAELLHMAAWCEQAVGFVRRPLRIE